MDVSTIDEYTLKEYFAINLKWYRLSNHYTQESLAELSNSTPKYISDLERGKFSPSLNKIEELAKGLNISAYLLLKPDEEHISEINKINSGVYKKRIKL